MVSFSVFCCKRSPIIYEIKTLLWFFCFSLRVSFVSHDSACLCSNDTNYIALSLLFVPFSFTKIVAKGMSKAEMILKVILIFMTFSKKKKLNQKQK